MSHSAALQTKLEQFREVLAATNPDALARLRPGRPRDEVQSRLAALPYEISPDAAELFTWADSTFEDPLEVLPSGYFMGLDVAITEFEEVHSMREELEEIFPQQYRDNFRFLTDFSDGGYAFGRMDSPSNGAIINLCIHDDWLLAYASLEDLIDTAIECRERGVFKPDDIPDFDLYYRIAKDLNPNMELWNKADEA